MAQGGGMTRLEIQMQRNHATTLVVTTMCMLASAVTARGADPSSNTEGSRLYREEAIDASIEAFGRMVDAPAEQATAPFVLYGIGVIQEQHKKDLPAAAATFERVIAAYPETYPALQASRKLIRIHRQHKAWRKAADECQRRLCLLAGHRPWLLTARYAQRIIDDMLDNCRHAGPSSSPEDSLRRIVAGKSKHSCPELIEAAKFALGADPNAASGNLLRNPGFERDGKYVPLEAPVGWRFIGTGVVRGTDNDGILDQAFLGEHGAPRTGRLCVGKYVDWATARGWYVQRIAATPRQRYACSVYALTGPQGDKQGRVRLGVDPRGGTDPNAKGIVWTAYRSTGGRYERIALDGASAVTAASDHVTVFLELRQDVTATGNVMLFEDAAVTRAGAPTPPPQAAVQIANNRPAPETPTLPCSLPSEETRMGYDPALLCGGLLVFNGPDRNKMAKKPEKRLFEKWRDETLPDICRQFRGCGMVSARAGLCWYNIENEKGHFDWRIADEKVLQLEQAGIVQVACIATSPPWALDPEAIAVLERQRTPANLHGCTQIKPECWDDYEAYMERLVLRYRDCIDHWEIWNEPDGMAGHVLKRDATGKVTSVEFGGDPDWMIELLKRSARVIRALDPYALICVGGFENKSPPLARLLEGVYARGGRDYFDAVGIHTYGTPLNQPWFCFLRQFMVDHGDGHKPMWVTEYGMRAQQDIKQAYRLRRSLRALREIPYVTIATGHVANMLFGNSRGHGYLAHQEMAKEKGPRPSWHQDFEGNVLEIIRNWEWDIKTEKREWIKLWANQELSADFPEQGERYLAGRSNGPWMEHALDVYVRPRKHTLSFLAYVDPPSKPSTVTMNITVEPGDVCKDRASVTLFPEGIKPHKWTRVEVNLAKAFPQFVEDTILAVYIRATSNEEKEWEFALDDIRIE